MIILKVILVILVFPGYFGYFWYFFGYFGYFGGIGVIWRFQSYFSSFMGILVILGWWTSILNIFLKLIYENFFCKPIYGWREQNFTVKVSYFPLTKFLGVAKHLKINYFPEIIESLKKGPKGKLIENFVKNILPENPTDSIFFFFTTVGIFPC